MPARPNTAERRYPTPEESGRSSATTSFRSSPRSNEVRAEEADIDQRQPECHQKDDHRERGAIPELKILQQGVEGVERDRLGRRPRSTSSKSINQIEHPKGIERSENQRNQDRRLEQRQGDIAELPPGRGSVDSRGFVERGIDVLEPGEQQKGDERGGLPHVGQNHRYPGGTRLDKPHDR